MRITFQEELEQVEAALQEEGDYVLRALRAAVNALEETDAELADIIRSGWEGRTDRGAEERLGVADRTALYRIDSLRADPHREMHTRGG